MRIAYLVNHYPKVSHSFIRREIRALESQGFEVSRFSVRGTSQELPDPEDLAEFHKTRRLLDGGLEPLAAALTRAALTRPALLSRALKLAYQLGHASERGQLVQAAYLAEACLLREWCQAAGVAHVHAHFGTNSTSVALLCRALGGPPYSFTSHGPEEYDRPQQLSLGLKVAQAAFAVAISDFGRSQLMRWCDRVHWSKVHVVRCGLDASFLAAPTSPVPSAPRLVNVGRFSEQKGQLLLIEAAGELRRRGLDFELVLVGDGELRAPIEARIAALGLEAQVRITGWASSEHVKYELERSRALVLPSFAEGLPIVIMEALALGRPVIASAVAGIPELVDERCGFLIRPGSIAALVQALEAVLGATPQTLSALGQVGRARVQALHDASANAAELGAWLRSELGPRGGTTNAGARGLELR